MNKTFAAILVAAAGFAAAPSFAENLDNPAFPEVQGTPVSRAQVQAELAQYQQQLHSQPARAEEPRYVASGMQPSTLTRAQVQADAIASRIPRPAPELRIRPQRNAALIRQPPSAGLRVT